MFERITFNPEIMGGRACIRGMRIPVARKYSILTEIIDIFSQAWAFISAGPYM